MDTTKTLFSRLRSLVGFTNYILPIHNLDIIEEYPNTLRRLEQRDPITVFRFRVVYLLLVLRLLNTVVLFAVPDLSISTRVLLSDYVLFLHYPPAFSLFNIVWVVMEILFTYILFHRSQDNPTAVMGNHFLFATNPKNKLLQKYIRVTVSSTNGFLQAVTLVTGVYVVICEVKGLELMFEVHDHISPLYFLVTQWNAFLLAFVVYFLTYLSAITMGNLIANNSLAIFRLHQTVRKYAIELHHPDVPWWSVYTYFRSLCYHLRVIHNLSKVYNYVSFGLIVFQLPLNVYINMLILLKKIPEKYITTCCMLVCGQGLSIFTIQILFTMYPRLVHQNVKLIHAVVVRGKVANVGARWKMAAHYEHFHVIESNRYGFTYLGISLITVQSFVEIWRNYTEMIMFSYNLIVPA